MNMDIVKHEAILSRHNNGKFKNKKMHWFKKMMIKISILLVLIIYLSFWINTFFEHNKLIFRSPIQSPVLIEKRTEAEKPYSVLVNEAVAEIVKPRYANAIDQYIYEKFGLNGDLAVQIARAENGKQDCDLIIIEPNDTVSMGAWMINSVHFKRFPPADLVDCYKNTDAAFQIYTEQGGFQAWSVYNNGAYMNVDINNYLNK